MTNQINAVLFFSDGPDPTLRDLPHPPMPNSALRDLVATTSKPYPRVILLATASGDSDYDVATYYRRMSQLNCHASDLSITRFAYTNREEIINSQDILYISDGSGPNLVAIWHYDNLESSIVHAVLKGTKIYAENEGASILFQAYDSRARGSIEIFQDGLGILQGTLIRHSTEQDFTDWGLPEPIYFVHCPVAIKFGPSHPPHAVTFGPGGEAWLYRSGSKSSIRTVSSL